MAMTLEWVLNSSGRKLNICVGLGNAWLSLKEGRGRGTWDVGRGTRGRGDFGTRRRAGIRGRDKQIAPDFCAELVKYFFLRVKCKIIC